VTAGCTGELLVRASLLWPPRSSAWLFGIDWDSARDPKDLKRRSRNRSQLFADVAVVEILANREEFTVSEHE